MYIKIELKFIQDEDLDFLMKVYSLVDFYWYLTFENVTIYERSYIKYNFL